jgi:hypothetical protein
VSSNPYGTYLPSFEQLMPRLAKSQTAASPDVAKKQFISSHFRSTPRSTTRLKPRGQTTPIKKINSSIDGFVVNPDAFVPRSHESIKQLSIVDDDQPKNDKNDTEELKEPQNTATNDADSTKGKKMPRLTREEYYTLPPMDELAQMPEVEICRVRNFRIGCPFGEVEFYGDVDLRDLDLDSIIRFEPKTVTVYPDDGPIPKPPEGQGLNRAARIRLFHCFPIDPATKMPKKDAISLEKFRKRVERTAESLGAKFVSYNSKTGEWVFEVPHF